MIGHVADRLRDAIVVEARGLEVQPSLLQAIIKTEARASGFQTGWFGKVKYEEPIILYECHVAYRVAVAKLGAQEANRLYRLHPDIINPYTFASKSNPYKYGKYSEQHAKLQKAVRLLGRTIALQACSWGIGQVLGENWEMCGYSSINELVNDAYGSEMTQLDMMCRYLKNKKGMLGAMRNSDYDNIAFLYNGKNYAQNDYHNKIRKAHVAYRRKYGS